MNPNFPENNNEQKDGICQERTCYQDDETIQDIQTANPAHGGTFPEDSETIDINEDKSEQEYVFDKQKIVLTERESGKEDDEYDEEEKLEKEEIIYYPNDKSPEVLLITCIDPRFRESFTEFGTIEFGHFVLLTIPGGIGPLTLNLMPNIAETVRRQIKFILRETNIEMVVLVSHDDCKWYHFNEGYFSNPQPEQQKLDIRSAKSILEERFEGITVLCYHAEKKGDRIEFSLLE